MRHSTAETDEQLVRLSIAAVDQLKFDPAEIGPLVSASYYSLGGRTLATGSSTNTV